MAKPTQLGLIAMKYIEKFPNSSKNTLAEKMYNENPLVFNDAEHARTVIRHYTGAGGKKTRKPTSQNLAMESDFSAQNPYGLPESEEKPSVIYKMPIANNNILVLSDVHLPYQNNKALTLALDYGKKENINTILLLGDIMDMHKASFHEQDPKKRDLAYEFEICRNFLDVLQKNFPLAKIFYKFGNHELRWERYLRVKAPVILDMQEFRLQTILRLGERGITWIANNQVMKIGKLYAIHGNEYKGSGGINAARTLWLRSGESTICGDKHKTQTMLKTNISGKVHGTFVIGCLCELNPDYLTLNEWNLGFAVIKVLKGGEFEVYNKSIIDGKVL
jgi:predicted phosphodiesterase